ncbi:MAG: TetR family transcriptional regulator C-terminal domain-containing protein [Ginsengibacter sp.]
MATAAQIQDAYIDYVLTNNEPPKSVYNFAKKLKISEGDFYKLYSSFAAIEKSIWLSLTLEAITEVKGQEVWAEYSSREKMLSFFYAFIELLKMHRSFILYSLKQHQTRVSTPGVLSEARPVFESFAEDVINEGIESGELTERKFLSKRYKDAVWLQFALILNFWKDDDSVGFEKTDEAIEKGINVTFDLFGRSPLDSIFEYGKFMTRNGKFKEKMGI